ncbi:MAG: Xaa-Pro peptidase family protein [Candidatus Woesearchaeota archaeon]
MRIKRLQEIMIKKNIDVVLVFSFDVDFNKNIFYFTNYKGIGIFCVLKDNSFLIVPEMEYEKAKNVFKKVYKAERKKRMLDTLLYLIRNKELKKVAFDMYETNVIIYKKLRNYFSKNFNGVYFEDAEKIFNELRQIKDENEIRLIKKACSVVDIVFNKICKNFNFKTEKELKRFIEFEIRKNNCDLSFEPIVASGKNSSMAHYNNEKDCRIKDGFLLLDFGAKFNEYCSDMTRMIYIGNPKKDEIENYNLVLKTIIECEKSVLKEKKFSKIYEKAIKILDEKSKFFTHSLGHGVGLDIHESPSLNLDDKNIIKDNVVFTIEPGIYFPNKYGIRIEDTIVYRKNKIEVLTKSKKELIIIKNNLKNSKIKSRY